MFTGQADKLRRNHQEFHDPARQQRPEGRYPLAAPPEPPPLINGEYPILDHR